MTRSVSTRTAWIVFLVLVFLLVAGTTMPGDLKSGIEGLLWSQIPWSSIAHYVLFTCIALCPVYGTGAAAVWRTILVAIFLAVLTELLQSLVPGRHPLFRDVLIDLGGTATALVLRSSALRQSAP